MYILEASNEEKSYRPWHTLPSAIPTFGLRLSNIKIYGKESGKEFRSKFAAQL